jgi:hypothetical protein
VPEGGSPDPAAPPVAEEGKRVRRRDLLNILNFINFREGTIAATFRQPDSGERVSVPVYPEPCLDQSVECRWLHPGVAARAYKSYVCEGFLIGDGSTLIEVKAEALSIDDARIVFRIPECGYEKSSRKIDRHTSLGVSARLVQAGLSFDGRLEDFNARSFKLSLDSPPGGSLLWINSTAPVTAIFSKDGEILYSGECRVIRMSGHRQGRELVLAPVAGNIRRFKPKKFRSQRYVLSPAPTMRFVHPLTGDKVQLAVRDVSAAGIGVDERFESSLLLPGMIIPVLRLEIANRLVLECRAQVLYRNISHTELGEEGVSCGLVFLDMEIADQARLSAIIHQSADDRLIVNGQVDMEELWRLFFESGFIYPSKYLSIRDHKDEFKRTYQKLYFESPSIARHFLVEDRGRLLGHMSMLRYYSNSWIIHHHSATRDGRGLAGVRVLDEISRYASEFCLHPSAHMDYIVCYYRQENRFPSRVFGGVVRDVADPKGASSDAFAYLKLEGMGDEEKSFQLFPAKAEEMAQLRRWYEANSGGLLLDALDLNGEALDDSALDAEYSRQGFKRDRHIFCLKQDKRPMAILVLTLSDIGLNLSNLTNCMHVLVLDQDRLQSATLFSAVRSLLCQYDAADMPVLVDPPAYLDAHGIRYEKTYHLVVLSLDHSDGYYESLAHTFRRTSSDGNGNDCG